jgi:hypothetical protein
LQNGFGKLERTKLYFYEQIVPSSIKDEIDRAAFFGQQLQDLFYNRAKNVGLVTRAKNDDLLLAYWSLLFDYSKGMSCLLQNGYYPPAFALARSMMEALVRASLVRSASDEELMRIRQDRYKVSYEKDARRIDKSWSGGPLFENLLKESQHWRCFDSVNHIGSGYTDREIWGLLGTASKAVFLITIVMTTHYGMMEETDKARALWVKFGREREEVRPVFTAPAP